jgi:hypothetical protein
MESRMDTAVFLIERKASGEQIALLKRKDREGKVDVIAVAGPIDRALIEEDGKLRSDWFTRVQDNYPFRYETLDIREALSQEYKNVARLQNPPLGAHFDAFLERLERAHSALAAFGWDSEELEDDIGPPPGGRI